MEGFEIRLASGADADRALDLAEAVWGSRPVNEATLRALELAGSYLSVAVDGGDRVVGMCLGMVGVHGGDRHLHSHLAAVDPAVRGSGIGRALKRHQRAWCLDHGIPTVSWTFDPLVPENARFNLHHLGARGERYVIELYGPMDDEINRGDPSDRLLVRWDLEDQRALAALDAPLPVPDVAELVDRGAEAAVAVEGDAPVFHPTPAALRLVATPDGIVALRRHDPDRARAWRLAVRAAMQRAFADGLAPVAVTADGHYVFTAEEAQ